MTAKTLLIAAGAFVAFGAAPALAGSGCSGYGSHANKIETLAEAPKSTAEDAQTQTAIPYPVPTEEGDTLTASVDQEKTTTTE